MIWLTRVLFPTYRGPHKTVTLAGPLLILLIAIGNAQRFVGGNCCWGLPRHHGLRRCKLSSSGCLRDVKRVGFVIMYLITRTILGAVPAATQDYSKNSIWASAECLCAGGSLKAAA
jgi:hypothetical protein